MERNTQQTINHVATDEAVPVRQDVMRVNFNFTDARLAWEGKQLFIENKGNLSEKQELVGAINAPPEWLDLRHLHYIQDEGHWQARPVEGSITRDYQAVAYPAVMLQFADNRYGKVLMVPAHNTVFMQGPRYHDEALLYEVTKDDPEVTGGIAWMEPPEIAIRRSASDIVNRWNEKEIDWNEGFQDLYGPQKVGFSFHGSRLKQDRHNNLLITNQEGSEERLLDFMNTSRRQPCEGDISDIPCYSNMPVIELELQFIDGSGVVTIDEDITPFAAQQLNAAQLVVQGKIVNEFFYHTERDTDTAARMPENEVTALVYALPDFTESKSGAFRWNDNSDFATNHADVLHGITDSRV